MSIEDVERLEGVLEEALLPLVSHDPRRLVRVLAHGRQVDEHAKVRGAYRRAVLAVGPLVPTKPRLERAAVVISSACRQ